MEKRRQFVLGWLASQLHAMVSLPGNLLSLNVCMLITSSVFTMTGACGLCFSRRWHFRDILSSSTIALQKDLYRRTQRDWTLQKWYMDLILQSFSQTGQPARLKHVDYFMMIKSNYYILIKDNRMRSLHFWASLMRFATR